MKLNTNIVLGLAALGAISLLALSLFSGVEFLGQNSGPKSFALSALSSRFNSSPGLNLVLSDLGDTFMKKDPKKSWPRRIFSLNANTRLSKGDKSLIGVFFDLGFTAKNGDPKKSWPRRLFPATL
jgi:hypothetical protein